MKTPFWLAVLCLTASLPTQAQPFKPIELKDAELAALRGRYVMPGRIISFGIVMSSTWQNANGELIGATSLLQIQQSTVKPQFYVSVVNEKGNSTATPQQGYGSVTGGAGLDTTQGVTQVVRAAGDNNKANNNVDINVQGGNQAPSLVTSGQVLATGSTITSSNGAGTVSITQGASGMQMNIVANNNQGSAMQSLSQGRLMQATTLLGGSNQVNNLTSLNVVLNNSVPSAGSLNSSLDQLKGMRGFGY
ncbi:hypothetical protein [Pseudomonas sp. NA-150]|uniref:hypothetical protein n=1 Tax=Pseudomonas sp. NA-150 TaxID=3367525 RepID=UPI0037C6C409